jgi:hypothetical protein
MVEQEYVEYYEEPVAQVASRGGPALGRALSVLTGVGLLTLLFYYLPASGALQIADPYAVERLTAYGLMGLGLLLLFVPVSLTLRLGPLWMLGSVSWWLLGYVIIFVPPGPGDAPSFFTYVAFLALVGVALASLFAVPMAALSRLFLAPPSSQTSGLVRAIRQGSLLSGAAVALLAMAPLGVLNWLNTVLVFTIAALTEFFFLARD